MQAIYILYDEVIGRRTTRQLLPRLVKPYGSLVIAGVGDGGESQGALTLQGYLPCQNFWTYIFRPRSTSFFRQGY